MTGRRKAERRKMDDLWVEAGERRQTDRREFLRRFSDLGAELEALSHRNDRDTILAVLALRLRDRGVVA